MSHQPQPFVPAHRREVARLLSECIDAIQAGKPVDLSILPENYREAIADLLETWKELEEGFLP